MAFSFGKMNDPDATLFIQVSEITGSTQRGAIVDLVKDLKSNNLWSKMRAIYPFVGGTAATHKWNLKDPRDVDAAFRLTFSGGWTHSTSGSLPNGTNAYANTYFVPGNNLSAGDAHLSYYSRTNTSASATTMGCDDGASSATGKYFRMTIRYTNDLGATIISAPNVGISYFGVTDARGLFMANAPSAIVRQLFRNGVSLATSSQQSYGPNELNTTQNVYLSALRSPSFNPAIEYDNKECAFATLGSSLTAAEAATFYTIVQKYQTTLGRQV
jgi:hypothetical protein